MKLIQAVSRAYGLSHRTQKKSFSQPTTRQAFPEKSWDNIFGGSPNRLSLSFRFQGNNRPAMLETVDCIQRTLPPNRPAPVNVDFHRDRRETFLKTLPPGSVVIALGNKDVIQNGDINVHAPRQDSNFNHLTGYEYGNAAMVLTNLPNRHKYTLFVMPHDPNEIPWHKIPGLAEARQIYGADSAQPIGQFMQALPQLLSGAQQVYFIPPRAAMRSKTTEATQYLGLSREVGRIQRLLEQLCPQAVIEKDARHRVHQLRRIRTPYEIAMLKHAVEMSAMGHKLSMLETGRLFRDRKVQNASIPVEITEKEIEAPMQAHFTRSGSQRNAYASIVAGDPTILHYTENYGVVPEGGLVLIDAGAEYGGYAADITRTWPVSGKFSPTQKAIYNAVLKAQLASIAVVKPGGTMGDVYRASVEVLTEELYKLGILPPQKFGITSQDPRVIVRQLIQKEAYLPYFMHGNTHRLGRDVHDYSEDPKEHPRGQKPFIRSNSFEPLAVGETITVEPGLYFSPELVKREGLDPKWAGIGVRIEDDVLVTETGHYVLSKDVPKTVQDIETLMAQ
jgi:Xaa-Pro aminopeptidase